MFSRYSSVCLEFLITHKNSLTGKIRLISKSMTSQPGLQTITIHILPNILRSKGNQTMKFAQFTEYIWETFFLKNHTQNVAGGLVPDSFLKNQNWAYLWINILKFYTVCFYCMPSRGLSKYTEPTLQTTCFYLK